MADIAAEGAGLSGKRTGKRDHLLLTGRLRDMRFPHREPVAVRIRNLSATGLRVEGALRLCDGDQVEIELNRIGTVPATVIWVDGNQVGARFTAPIDPALARRTITPKEDEHLRKLVDLGRIRRPGLRIG